MVLISDAPAVDQVEDLCKDEGVEQDTSHTQPLLIVVYCILGKVAGQAVQEEEHPEDLVEALGNDVLEHLAVDQGLLTTSWLGIL
jgi:uncharacterized membrane protein YqgA involved in biofilm formation